VGLGTWLALSRGTAFGAVPIGAWTAWPKRHARHRLRARGLRAQRRAPLGSGDGSHSSPADDAGRPLDGRCDVLVMAPRLRRDLTLTLYDPQRLIGNSVDRQGFTSQEIVRNADGSFDIVIAPRARAGNWLPTNAVDSYVLLLRLYDSPVGVATRAAREVPMPALQVQSCP
jgi:hypothetical protein